MYKAAINLLIFLAITMMFSDTAYIVDENTGPARPVLALSNPSSTDINVSYVTMTNTDGSATGVLINNKHD